MTKEEVARLVEAASHLLAAAAQLKLGPRVEVADMCINEARSLITFAIEMERTK